MKVFAALLLLACSVSLAWADQSSTTLPAPPSGTVSTDVNQVQTEEKAASPYGSVSGNLAGTSDYIFRGQSLTQHDPAAQGEIDWTHSSGAYLGAWGSNVSIPGSATPMEIDFYGGYNYTHDTSIGTLGAGLGVMYYSYIKGTELNTFEYPLTVSWNDVKAGVAYAPYWTADGDEWYLSIGWNHKTYLDTTLVLAVGYSIFAPEVGTPNYADFHAGLQHDFFGLTWDASGYFVNAEPTTDGLYGPRAVLTVSKNL